MSDKNTGPAIADHGGAGGSTSREDGCRKATEAGTRGLAALEAVVAAGGVLEDDGRFNAGSGFELGLDGEHIIRHMLAREVYQWIAGSSRDMPYAVVCHG